MIRFYTFFISILSSLTLISQTNNYSKKYELIGALQTNDKQIISYKIIFYEKENGEIEGESITDFYGNNSTISKITGKIDKINKTISFKEKSNISTKSKAKENSFCYVNVDNISIATIKDKNIIQGEFSGKFNNNQPCVNGKIYLVSASILELLNEENISKIKSKIDTSNIDMSQINKLFEHKKELKSNDTLIINWSSKKLNLTIWDSYSEDGDIVSIFVNKKLVKGKITIKEKKHSFEIPLENGKNEIKIVAINEGETSPNTMNAILKDNEKEYPIISKLKQNEAVIIILE